MQSRLTRLEERRVKRRIIVFLGASIVLILSLALVGVPLLVKLSVLIGNSKTPQISQDTTPPFTPMLDSLPDATNSAQIIIRGYGEPESKVELFQNDRKVKDILIGSDGNFVFNALILKEGKNVFVAQAFDRLHNTSPTSAPIVIHYLTKPPKLEVVEPAESQRKTSNEQFTVKGFTDENVGITVNERLVNVSEDGSFQFPYKLKDGENKLTIVALDEAGNRATVERTITYER